VDEDGRIPFSVKKIETKNETLTKVEDEDLKNKHFLIVFKIILR
jgi:hypothetical protein